MNSDLSKISFSLSLVTDFSAVEASILLSRCINVVSKNDLPGIQLFVRSIGIQDKVNTGVFYRSLGP